MELVQPTLHDNTLCSPSSLNVIGDTTTAATVFGYLHLLRYFVLSVAACFINIEVMCHLVLYLLCQWLPMDLHTVAIGLYNKDTVLALSNVPKLLQNVNTIWPGTRPCSLVDEYHTPFSDIKI